MPRFSDKQSLSRARFHFTEDYKMQIFTLWYNSGKPNADRLYSLIISENIKEPLSGEIPNKNTLVTWVRKDFEIKATFLDAKAIQQLEKQLVQSKLEMLNKHADVGRELYTIGMEYLKENGLGNSRNALSAVVEGLRIERESSGTTVKFAELDKMSDEELFAELASLVQGSKIISVGPNYKEE